jgi:hypothetical protein
VRRCRECACTDEQGCPEDCSWVEPDLCSSCQARALAEHPLIRAPLAVELPLYVWLGVHGNLLLALRHPENDGKSRTMVDDVVALLEGAFLDAGLLTEVQVERMHEQEDEARQRAAAAAPRIIIPGM